MMAITGGEIIAAGRATKVLTSKAKGLVLGDADEREIRTCALNAIDAAVAAATDRVPLASERIALGEALWQILADENAGIAWLLEPVIFGAQGELAEKFDELLIDRLRVLRETVPEIGESWEVAAGVDLDRFRDTFQREINFAIPSNARSFETCGVQPPVSATPPYCAWSPGLIMSYWPTGSPMRHDTQTLASVSRLNRY